MKTNHPTRPARQAASLLALLAALLAPGAQAGSTLDAVRSRGQLVCGVDTGLPGFAAADAAGIWKGLDVDICRAVAAAVLGDAEKVRYAPLSGANRFAALQAGEIDLLSRTTTITLGLDHEWLARAIRVTGNYGEIFDRNLGAGSPIGVPRGLNQLWNRGGLHYAPPVR